MVEHDGQLMVTITGVIVTGGEDPDTNRPLGGEVETGTDHRRHLGAIGCHRPVELIVNGVHRVDDLPWDSQVVDVSRPQDLVSGNHIADCGTQRMQIQRSGDTYLLGDVVGGRSRLEPVDEPDTLLGKRQRDGVRSR